ncbi:hypothetical protein C8A00DRAFT_34300 [Chaetomidium leptoderma]|uniref:Nephrocystin 3-like N-terminal domain-containing protein n=1 Tax=Chaetomidium leptoderma TaxID=669021 RepID=A0AAN6VK00_9PEZI|nr:hypothetical protein C8A00DRAFT_34300 [Chaetomidium leptoderma]
MATGLEALGLACNIMQVISFAGGLISTFNAIRGGHSPDVAITTTATQMSNAFKTLAQSLGQATRPLNKDEMEMAVIAEQCLDAAVALKAEVDKIWDGNTKGSYKAALTGAARKMLNQGKIERLEKVLRVHRETIENRLLQRICTRSDAILLHQDSGFEKLDASLRRFIAAFAAGETRLAGLIGDQSESVKEHVTLETGQLRDDLYTHMASESGKTHVVLSEMSARVTSEVSQTRRELSLKFKETAAAQASEAEHQRLLKSLEYETMNERRNQVVESYRDTFHWIFGPSHDSTSLDAERTDNGPIKPSVRAKSSESFLRWLHSEGPALYWISGKAGSGKSTLMKFLVDNPQTEAGLGDFTIISHFVWMAGQPMERSIRGIACSLLRQLLQDDPGVSALVLNMIPRSRRNKFSADWSVNDLEAALMLALAASPKPVCVFLNGLDEIDPLEEQDKALNLVDKLSSRVSRLRICVSSRPEPIFQRRLGNFPALRLQDLTREDIRRYTSGALRRDFVSTDPEFREFVEQVCDKSDGVFLWVALAVKSLQRGKQDENTVAELRKRLETLPSDLHRLYEGMWQRLNDDEPIYREDGARFLNYVLRGKDFYGYGYVFDWDVCELMLTRDNLFRHKILEEGYRPSRDEWISRVKATTKQLVRRCAGLLEITGTTEVTPSARLIHRSAKEFLENTPHGQQILQYDTSTMEDRIFNVISAEIALTRLNVLQQVGEDVLPLTAHESSLSDMVERLLILFYRGCPRANLVEVAKY